MAKNSFFQEKSYFYLAQSIAIQYLGMLYSECKRIRRCKMEHAKFKEILSPAEAAKTLNITTDTLNEWVEQNVIPHSILPNGDIVFLRNLIYKWLESLDPTLAPTGPKLEEQKAQLTDNDELPQLVKTILKRTGYSHKSRLSWGYLNLYKRPQKTFAQIHFSASSEGVDLALWERGPDKDLPSCSVLKRIEHLSMLSGYRQANNRCWLIGQRLTKEPVAAFNVPFELQTNPNHPGWKELEELLSYTYSKR